MACTACAREPESGQSFLQCARCRTAAYCSKDCQSTDWPKHKDSCKRPNYIMKFDLGPESIKRRLRAVISDPPVSRTLSCPATATFAQLHRALQIAFGWSSTHTYDFAVFDPGYWEASDRQENSLAAIIQRRGLGFRTAIRGSILRQHPRTKEQSAYTTKLFQMLETSAYTGKDFIYTYDFGDRWEHTINVVGRRPASDDFECIDGSGHGVAEDVVQTGWAPLKEAYRAARPSQEQREQMKWYETQCSNGDRQGLRNGREHVWDKDAINARLRGL